jgi:rhamnosyltransferase
LRQEFSRYFDFGVFHSRESWIRERFGQAEGEGMRFLRSQLGFLWRRQPSLVPLAMTRMTVKLAGFRLGTLEKHLPVSLKRRMSMNKKYWDRHRD